MSVDDIWKSEFDACQTGADYEAYVRKYYKDTDNPFLDLAKQRIRGEVRSKNKAKEMKQRAVVMLCVAILSAAAAVGLFFVMFTQEGKSADTVYHGPHGDFKHTDYSVLILGPGAGLAGLALAGVSCFCFYTFFALTFGTVNKTNTTAKQDGK